MIPKLQKPIKLGILIGLAIAILSFFTKIIPCKIITATTSQFAFCNLPSLFSNLKEPVSEQFYGISTNPLTGFLLQFLIPFILVLLVSAVMGSKLKRKNKVVDLTKK